jgi:hypothetical protein
VRPEAAMNWGIRLSAIGAALLLVSCSQLSDAALQVSKLLAENRFERLCAERGGLEIDTRSGIGGAVSDNPNIGQNLWLIFDFGLPFVEFERRAAPDDDALLVREWGPIPRGGAVWRVERRPAGDAACATFEAWLGRVSQEEFGYDALPTRWRERAAYGGACFALEFHALETSSQAELGADSPRYFLRSDAGRVERIGCYDAHERRYALVDRWGRRAFTVNALSLRDFRCHVDGPGEEVASCGNPITDDVSGKRAWFVDDSSPAARAALAAEQSQ